MKKFLLSLAILGSAIFGATASDLICTLSFSSSNEKQTKTSSYTNTWTTEVDGYKWSITAMNNNNNGWAYVKCGRSGNASTAYIINSEAFSATIDKITINAKRYSSSIGNVNSAKIYVLSAVDATDAEATYDFTTEWNAMTTSAGDVEVPITTPVAGKFFKIEIDMPSYSTNGAFWIYNVMYYGEQDQSLLNPEITFPEEAYTATIGETFTSPVATTKSDGTVSYSSSDTSVATVDATTGEVTLVAQGTAEIKAVVEATSSHLAGSASYTLTVIDPSIIYTSALGADWTFEQGDASIPWSHSTSYGLYGTGYANSTQNVTDAYAVSPEFDLTNYTEPVFSFQQALNQFKLDNVNIAVSEISNYVSLAVREVNGSWNEIEDAITLPSSQSWTFYDNKAIDLNSYAGKKIQVGFHYTSTDSVAGTWEIKNIVLKADKSSGVENIEVNDEVEPVYYNLQGVRVAHPGNGVYIVVKGNKSSKVVF